MTVKQITITPELIKIIESLANRQHIPLEEWLENAVKAEAIRQEKDIIYHLYQTGEI